MTARPLPEAVERRLQAALLDAYNHGWAVGARVKAPVGPDNHEAALRAAIAAAMAPGEPVAWGVFNGTSFKCAYDDERAAREDYPRYTVVPLYAAPLHSASAGEVDKARVTFYEAARAYVEAKVEGTPHGCTYLDLKRAHDSLLAAERADRKGGDDAR